MGRSGNLPEDIQGRDFLKALRNSIVFNILDLALQFPIPIILALMLNELRYARFKKVTQTILSAPLPFLGHHRKRGLSDVPSPERYHQHAADELGADR